MSEEMKMVKRADMYDRLAMTMREFVLPVRETSASRFWRKVLAEHMNNKGAK